MIFYMRACLSGSQNSIQKHKTATEPSANYFKIEWDKLESPHERDEQFVNDWEIPQHLGATFVL